MSENKNDNENKASLVKNEFGINSRPKNRRKKIQESYLKAVQLNGNALKRLGEN